MKKLLLATTAVAGLMAFAPAAQAEIDLNVGGSFKAYYGLTDQDLSNRADDDLKRKGEIHFSGETTLDNGLTVGVHTEMVTEQGNNSTAAVEGEATDFEEAYMYFSGNWGRLNIGAEDGAAYLLQVAAPSADSNIDGLDPEFRFVNNITEAKFDYASNVSHDSDKLTYLSPKLNGFQLGASYAPDADQKEAAGENLGGAQTDSDPDDLANLYEVAVRYDGEMDNVGFHLGAGYSAANAEASGEEDHKEWNVGGKVAFDQFTFGAAYNLEEGIDDEDIDTYILAGDYTFGAYKVGVSYLESDKDRNGVSDDEVERFSFGGIYNYAPGLSFRGSVNLYDMESGDNGDNDATSFLIGTDISF